MYQSSYGKLYVTLPPGTAFPPELVEHAAVAGNSSALDGLSCATLSMASTINTGSAPPGSGDEADCGVVDLLLQEPQHYQLFLFYSPVHQQSANAKKYVDKQKVFENDH